MAGIVVAATIIVLVALRINSPVRVLNPLSRIALLSGVCGLMGYIYYGIGLPGSSLLDGFPSGLRGLLVGFLCGLLPLIPILLVSRLGRKGT
jgi:hypothetical protein